MSLILIYLSILAVKSWPTKQVNFRPLTEFDPVGSSNVPRGSPSFVVGNNVYLASDTTSPYDGQLRKLIRTGETFGDQTFGQVINNAGESKWLHWALDYAGLLYRHGKVWMLSHHEARIGMMYITEVEMDEDTGVLTPVKTTPLLPNERIHPDMKFVSAPVSGSTTPWNTFLSVLEYPLDPKWLNDPTLTTEDICFKWHLGSSWPSYLQLPEGHSTVFEFFNVQCDTTKDLETLKQEFLNLYGSVYWNGVSMEIDIAAPDDFRWVIHWAMGRYSGERPVVMPDQRTVYITSDMYTDTLYKFVADTPMHLSSGTLYTLKANQLFDAAQPLEWANWDIEWISLGHASDSDFDESLIETYNVDMFFDFADLTGDQCPDGFVASEMHKLYAENVECLRLKSGLTELQIKLASRLETQRYAATLGATQELSKVEGVTYDAHRNALYIALSYVEKAMGKNDEWDFAGNDHIGVPENRFGCVFQLELDESYSSNHMSILVCGSEDTFQNPDNIDFFQSTLVIAEDSYRDHDTRLTNFAWTYDVHSGELTPILQGVNGAQIAMGYHYGPFGDLNGKAWEYLVFSVQHPYKGYDLPAGCDPLGENPECGVYTGTGDWIVYYKWARNRCDDHVEPEFDFLTNSDSEEENVSWKALNCPDDDDDDDEPIIMNNTVIERIIHETVTNTITNTETQTDNGAVVALAVVLGIAILILLGGFYHVQKHYVHANFRFDKMETPRSVQMADKRIPSTQDGPGNVI